MSETIRIVNGQIDMNPSTGQPNMVSGNRKCAQDLAECLLQDYLASQQYGSYLRAVVRNQIAFATELLVRYYISQAISQLESLQQIDPNITDDEQIQDIQTILITPNNDGVVGFFVSVSTVSGQSSMAGAAIPTQLNQLTESI